MYIHPMLLCLMTDLHFKIFPNTKMDYNFGDSFGRGENSSCRLFHNTEIRVILERVKTSFIAKLMSL